VTSATTANTSSLVPRITAASFGGMMKSHDGCIARLLSLIAMLFLENYLNLRNESIYHLRGVS
jgi:hypothetical protein